MSKETEFLSYLKEISLLKQATSLLEWDNNTGMPAASAGYRAEVSGYLSGLAFDKANGQQMGNFMAYFANHPDELSPFGQAVYEKAKEEYELNHSIPAAEFQAYAELTSKAQSIWAEARAAGDFKLFEDTLEQLVDFNKTFIPLWRKQEKTPYDVLLDQYEPGMTTEKLDSVFSELKDGLLRLRQLLAEKGKAPRTDFLTRRVPKELQRQFVTQAVSQLGYDFDRGRLDETVHPFMMNVNRNDARITTRWMENQVQMAVFGVIHEAGHGIYEQNIDALYDYTPLAGGVSMGIHESQSLFYEKMIGGHPHFWDTQYPIFRQITGDTFQDIDCKTFYNGLHKTESSLIRIEADSLTYPLHIIIRYEIEKMLFNGDVSVAELPQIWDDKYEEYLGIRPENDGEGILQDIHWAGGSFGYFPSYALGYMYAAQLYAAMNKELSVDDLLLAGDYLPIRAWLTRHIHQFGGSRKPDQLIREATGEALNPKYLLDHLEKTYRAVYDVR